MKLRRSSRTCSIGRWRRFTPTPQAARSPPATSTMSSGSRPKADGQHRRSSTAPVSVTDSTGRQLESRYVAGDPLYLQSLFAAIVRSSDDAIISKDLNSIVTSWNAAAEQMFGYTAQEMIGRSIRTIIPADRQHEEDSVLARVREGLTVDHYETIRLHKSGALVNISLSVSPVRNAAGVVVRASQIARDISERLRAQAITDRARRQGIFLARLTAAFSGTMDYAGRLTALARLSVPDLADWCAVDALRADGQIERVAINHIDPDKIALAGRILDRYRDPHAPASPSAVMRTGKPAIVSRVTDEMLVDAAAGDEEWLRLLRWIRLLSYVGL